MAAPTIEEILEKAYDTVKDDVEAELKAHPSYGQVITALVTKGISELITLAGG